MVITIKAKAGEGGRLFGSVTAADIAEAIEEQSGAVIDRRTLALDSPLKELGRHEVTVRLHSDVEAAVAVEIVAD